MSARLGIRDLTNPTDRTDRTDPLSRTARPRAGYTLIELVSVAALGTILISLAVAGYHTWTRDNSVVSAQRRVQSLLARARSHALAYGVETRWRVVDEANPTPDFRSHALVLEARATPTGPWRLIAPTNRLPDWTAVNHGPGFATNLIFGTDGTCRTEDAPTVSDPEPGWHRLELGHIQEQDDPRYLRVLEVNRRTGLVREGQPGGNP